MNTFLAILARLYYRSPLATSKIGEIRQKAKDLEAEANREVEAAKAEVERMILGDD